MKARLLVFAAPSGSGKTTIVRDVLSNYKDFVFSISATTRSKRPVEKDGIDYFFIGEEEFKKKIDAGEFVEWEKFYDYYYGTLKSTIEENLRNGLTTVLEVDVKGAISIKNVYQDAVLIFIAPPSIEELRTRLINRNTETDEDLKKRIARAEMELGFKDKFDHVVINIDLEKAKEEVKKIINKEISKEE
jgi:guanylate kinase